MSDTPKSPDSSAPARRLRQGLGLIALGATQAGGAVVRLAWLWIKRAGGLLLAILVLFEQWGWEPLVALFKRIGHLAPIAALERVIGHLPPYAALLAFGLPTAFLLPLKLLALYLIAHGHAVIATALFIGAKVVGTAVVARLYQLTSPQLMQIGWFKRAHDFAAPRLHNLHEDIRRSWTWRYGRMLKARVKHNLTPALTTIKVRLARLLPGLRR
jgi:hypothetical protein